MADYSTYFPSPGGGDAGADYSKYFPSAPPVSKPPTREELAIPGEQPRFIPQWPTKTPSIGERLYGAGEAGLTALTAIPAGILGNVAGVGRSVFSGKLGTQEGVRAGLETQRNVQEALTFSPRTEAGRDILGDLGRLVDATKIAGIGPTSEIAAAGALAGPAAARVGGAVRSGVDDVFRPQPAAIPGFGSAMTSPEELRRVRAASLPIPIDLTKGQGSRDFQQLQFEREIAKTGVGGPLLQKYAKQNQDILSNFDEFSELTGAQAPELRATGKIVTSAIAEKANKARDAIRAAYDKARETGDMQAFIETKPLAEYLTSKAPESINAPVISSAAAKLAQIAQGGKVTVNELEEIRKMVGQLGGKDATNALFAKEIKGVIDAMTEGAGGAEYQRARYLRARYAKEFENVGVVDKLMSTKPGTTDRAVAFEDVFQHSVLSGSLDDVRAIRRTLQTAGESGEQAWRELQGQTVNYLKESATRNAQRDVRGNPIVSFAGLNKAVNSLDADGKLDFIFGKNGAQQVRDMRDLTADVYTVPPGALNTSNTASAWWRLLQSLPGAKTVGVAKELVGQRRDRKMVQEALQLPPPR